jgi:hypothetical protein
MKKSTKIIIGVTAVAAAYYLWKKNQSALVATKKLSADGATPTTNATLHRRPNGHIVGCYNEQDMYDNNVFTRSMMNLVYGGYEFYGGNNEYIFAKKDSYDWYDPNEEDTTDKIY